MLQKVNKMTRAKRLGCKKTRNRTRYSYDVPLCKGIWRKRTIFQDKAAPHIFGLLHLAVW